jgi:predicted RND superfamily exporter protein
MTKTVTEYKGDKMEKLKKYLDYSVERAVKTIAQSMLATIAAASALSIIEVDFGQVLGIAALAGLLSLLTSVLTFEGKVKATESGA